MEEVDMGPPTQLAVGASRTCHVATTDFTDESVLQQQHKRHRAFGSRLMLIIVLFLGLAVPLAAVAVIRQDTVKPDAHQLHENWATNLQSTTAETKTTSELPHVIFFLIDDQGFDDMGYQTTSNDYIPYFTPTLDSAAENGVILEWYYSDHLCSPSRASILTGKNLLHNGVSHDVFSEKSPNGLALNHKLLPQYMNDIGYQSHAIGKWHLGFFNHQYLPTSRGFQSYLGYYSGNLDWYGHYVTWGTTKMYDFHSDESAYYDTSTYTLELFDARAQQLISSHNPAEPMFLYYATQGIHGGYDVPPEKFLTDSQIELAEVVYTVTDSAQRKLLATNSAAMDTTFSNLLAYLKNQGMYENSVIIVASDNGGCSNTVGSNYPLRGQKNSLFEGGVRVNAFVHSPLLADAQGTRLECVVHNVDWLPTILQGVAGYTGEIGALDGVNHWEAIKAADKSSTACARVEMVHLLEVGTEWEGHKGKDTLRAGLRWGDYKLVYGQVEAGWWDDRSFSADDCDVVPDDWPDWGYVFNVKEDPTEKSNLMDRVEDEVLSHLWTRLDDYFQHMANPSWRGTDLRAKATWTQNDRWMRPWVSDADLGSPRDAWQAEMAEGQNIDIDGHGHAHPVREPDAGDPAAVHE